MENWKCVKNNENYMISDKGNIKRIFKKYARDLTIRKEFNDKTPHVSLSKKGKQNVISIARLVYTNFTDNWDFSKSMNSFTIYHKDSNLQNCCYDNLYIKHHANAGRSGCIKGEIGEWVRDTPLVSFIWSNNQKKRYLRFKKQGKHPHEKHLNMNNLDEYSIEELKLIYKDWLLNDLEIKPGDKYYKYLISD